MLYRPLDTPQIAALASRPQSGPSCSPSGPGPNERRSARRGGSMRIHLLLVLACGLLVSFVSADAQQTDPCQHWATGVPSNPFPAGFGPWNCYLIEYVGYTCLVYTFS